MTDALFLKLALKHNIPVEKIISTNELGLDYRTAIAEEQNQKRWLLRIPRRIENFIKIQQEEQYLQFLKSKVSFNIPDWNVVTPELIAYPLLIDSPALEVDLKSNDFNWNIDLNSFDYSESLAAILFELHSISTDGIRKSELKKFSTNEIRQELLNEIDLVKAELGIPSRLEKQWRAWINEDSYWPEFSVLNHGDLYAGHTLVNSKNQITGVIDWSEMQVGDSSLDFTGHYVGLGEKHLDKTIEVYKKMGGRTWSRMKEHIICRASVSPLKFAIFALSTKNNDYIQSARDQLGL